MGKVILSRQKPGIAKLGGVWLKWVLSGLLHYPDARGSSRYWQLSGIAAVGLPVSAFCYKLKKKKKIIFLPLYSCTLRIWESTVKARSL